MFVSSLTKCLAANLGQKAIPQKDPHVLVDPDPFQDQSLEALQEDQWGHIQGPQENHQVLIDQDHVQAVDPEQWMMQHFVDEKV